MRDIQTSINIVSQFKADNPEAKIEIRYLKGFPTYRLTIVDLNHDNPYAWIRLFVNPRSIEVPAILLEGDDEEEWRKYFADQFEENWLNAEIAV